MHATTFASPALEGGCVVGYPTIPLALDIYTIYRYRKGRRIEALQYSIGITTFIMDGLQDFLKQME